MDAKGIIADLKRQSNPANVAGMARFGINAKNTLGIPIPVLRQIARHHKRQHLLAKQLWESGIHEARILASMVDDPEQVTAQQMESWAKDFDSWDVCDQVCSNLFDKTRFAHEKCMSWSGRNEEFVRRAGFTMMATLAVHDKKTPDTAFIPYLHAIKSASTDNRNFVRKAVNWALRQIGKRSLMLHAAAIATAEDIATLDNNAARWIAGDALKELHDPKTIKRIKRR